MFIFTRYLIPALAIFMLVSCQQDVQEPPPDPTIPPVLPPAGVDSTKLLKSLTYYLFEADGVTVRDSVKETYQYDTIARTIKLDWEAFEPWMDGASAVFSYSTDHKLTSVNYIYPPGFNPTPDHPGQLSLEYDGENILKRIIMKTADGNSITRDYTRTLLPAGYQLSFDQTTFDGTVWHYVNKFTSDGRFVSNTIYYTYDIGGGPSTETYTDSLAYDAGGSVVRCHSKHTSTGDGTTEEYIYFEFTGRESRGMELYNQRRLILGDKLDFIFTSSDDQFDGELGILSFFNGEQHTWEFIKYPITGAKVQFPDFVNGGYITYSYSSTSEFDAQGRLRLFRGYVPEEALVPNGYRLEYYK